MKRNIHLYICNKIAMTCDLKAQIQSLHARDYIAPVCILSWVIEFLLLEDRNVEEERFCSIGYNKRACKCLKT